MKAADKRQRPHESPDTDDSISKKLKIYSEIGSLISQDGFHKNWHFSLDAVDDPINVAFAKIDAPGCFVYSHNANDLHLFVDGKPAGSFVDPDIKTLTELASPAPFGQKALQIEGSRITFQKKRKKYFCNYRATSSFTEYLDDFSTSAVDFSIAQALPLGMTAISKLYKLHIYPTGEHFDWHANTQRSQKHFASGIIILGNKFQGGDLLVKHENDETRVNQSTDMQHCTFASWYTDCSYRVEPVTFGSRIVLQYDIQMCKNDESLKQILGDGMTGGVSEIQSISALNTLCEEAKRFWTSDDAPKGSKPHRLALLLRHCYMDESLSPGFLKGVDRCLYNAFSEKTDDFEIRLEHIIMSIYDREAYEDYIVVGTMDERFSDEPVTLFLGSTPAERAFVLFSKPGMETGNEAQLAEEKNHYAALVIGRKGTPKAIRAIGKMNKQGQEEKEEKEEEEVEEVEEVETLK